MPRASKPRNGAAKRQELIDAALRLFARDGYRATGIDTILAEAGVAKMTLYHHFGSKEELILAALRQRDEEWRAWFQERVEAKASMPRARLDALFDVLEEWFRNREYHGCSFARAASEYREPRHAIHRLAREHEQHLLDYLRTLASAAGARDPDLLARQLGLLVGGAITHMELFREPEVARTADAAAQSLIESACATR
jgi:AcrR family transcriptional regulator